MKCPRKRTLLMVLLLLTGGAIINVAVAWVLAVTLNVFDGGEPVQWRQIQEHMVFWQGQSKYRRGGVWIAARFVRTAEDFSDTAGEYSGSDSVPKWSGFAQQTEEFRNGEAQAVWRWADGRGWPVLSVWSETKRFNDVDMRRDVVPAQWGIQTKLPDWTGARGEAPRVLPLHPIWPGFAINTMFYAAILWLLFAAPGFVRRRLRARRGQCPACAYPVGASEVCTECGTAFRK